MAPIQNQTLRIFTALSLARQTWAGSLLVGLGLNGAGQTVALASLAAGAASIMLEQDPARLRSAQRDGCCTCTVTSLDEALRIAKNEVRQDHAVTIGLRGDPAAWLHEMVERGLQPQAFASSRVLIGDEAAAVNVLCERGMQTFCGLGLCRIGSAGADLEEVLTFATRGSWSVDEQQTSTSTERRVQDKMLLEAVTQEDAMSLITRKWLQAAPTLFPHAHERSYWRRLDHP